MGVLTESQNERLLVVGETPVARRVCATLAGPGSATEVIHLVAPTDAQLSAAIASGVGGVAVLIRDDVSALRYALAVAHLGPGIPMVVTIFDRTIADQLRAFLPESAVISSASLAAPSLVGPCLGPSVLASFSRAGHSVNVLGRSRGFAWQSEPHRSAVAKVGERVSNLWPVIRHQPTGSRLLTLGLLGLLAVLLLDAAWLLLIEGKSLAEAYVGSARVVATVGPAATHVSPAYAAFAGTAMLLTIFFAALFTAGVVERLVSPPMAAILGRRAVPRRGHVIVVGLGQVGIRLCSALRSHDIPVVGVERDSSAPLLPLARALGIPVVVGTGSERQLLERLELHRSRAVAAVASDDLDNIAVAVAASAVAPRVPVVLRAGEQEAIGETRSLLPLGVTRDVTAIAAGYVVSTLRGQRPRAMVADIGLVYAQLDEESLVHVSVSRRDECAHT